MALADGKNMLLTTFRRDGTPVSTPVWVVGLDGGRVGFTTSSGSGKYKRLRHTERVTVQPCDVRGRVTPGTTVENATAALVSGPEYLAIRSKVRAKYGVMWNVTKFLGLIGGLVKRHRIPYGDVAVVITPTA
jgi:PPOX class probable F420-dependent enzyme